MQAMYAQFRMYIQFLDTFYLFQDGVVFAFMCKKPGIQYTPIVADDKSAPVAL